MTSIHFAKLRTARRIRQFNYSLMATLAAMALTACGGGGSAGDTATSASLAPSQPAQLLQEDGTPMPAAPAAREGIASAAAAAKAKAQVVSLTNSDGLAIPAYLWQPANATGAVPTVVMLHGCAGVYSYSDATKDFALIHTEWAQRLNAAGYAALLVDSFTPRGTQNQCDNGTAGVNEAVDRPKDALAARNWLVANGKAPVGKVALLGWSNGASAAMATMDVTKAGGVGNRPFAEAFALYPGCGLINEFGGLAGSTWLPSAPVTIHHGTTDPLYTDGKCTTRVARAQTLGASSATGNAVTLVTYTGARHSFDQTKNPAVAPFTTADVDAKATTDAAVMTRLAVALAP